jgi:AbrB family looped-hinge helix DNA binding protein
MVLQANRRYTMTISKTTIKGQVVIPAQLRKKFNIKKGTRVAVMEGEGRVILIKPLPDDPIEASRGMLKGKTSLTKALLRDRQEEAKRG